MRSRGKLRRASALAIIAAQLAGCQSAGNAPPTSAAARTPDEAIRTARTSLGKGYLAPAALPDSLLMVPPPPAAGSAALARDEEAQAAALALRGGARWVLATADAELLAPAATGTMSCAAGIRIDAQETPAIQKLLRRAAADLGLSGYGAKRKYMRPRPFMANGQPSCTPDWEVLLRKDGSYPSGHSAVGYGWALLLAEIIPDRAAQLVARGRAYGDSRRVCNVHWLSDVEEGRVTAAAVIARLHAAPEFQRDMADAKKEFAKIRSTAAAPDCNTDAAGLGATP
jgi:acid phosphatase (class A)